MSCIQGKTIPAFGAYGPSPAVVLRELYRVLEEATWKQGMIGQEVGDFLTRLAGPAFSGKVS